MTRLTAVDHDRCVGDDRWEANRCQVNVVAAPLVDHAAGSAWERFPLEQEGRPGLTVKQLEGCDRPESSVPVAK